MEQIRNFILENDYIIVDGEESESFMEDFYPFPREKGEVKVVFINSCEDVYFRIVKRNKLVDILMKQKYFVDYKKKYITNMPKKRSVFNGMFMVIINKKKKEKDYDIMACGSHNNKDRNEMIDVYLKVCFEQSLKCINKRN